MAAAHVPPTLRAGVFALVAVSLGASAHAIMAHAEVPAWALLAGGVGAFVPARIAAARGERGFASIAVTMAALQVVLHLLFCFAQQVGQSTQPGSDPTAMSGSAMPAGMKMPGMAGASGFPYLHVSGGMLLAHALAALACSWWLRRGEAAAHALVRSAAFRVRGIGIAVVWVLPPADRVPTRVRIPQRVAELRPQCLSSRTLARRGPPAPSSR